MDDSGGGHKYDTIIIGCGMAGLAAGIRLALFDKRVLILEKHNAPGGLNSFYFKDGRKFDVGLHAVTNFLHEGRKSTPMAKLLRQLRISRDSIQLAPQTGSRIAFPHTDLRFANDFGLLESEVERVFPRELPGFRKLRQVVREFDSLDLDREQIEAREVVRRYIGEPLLESMLFCPLMYYGSARERNMDFDQFATLWQAIYEEGFGRPVEGVRAIIRVLLDRYRELGGKRRMRCGVRRILLEDGKARGVETETGETYTADTIFSTAGWPETLLLCGEDQADTRIQGNVGKLSFAETISITGEQPASLGSEETIVFFNDSEHFHYEAAREAIDLRSGVICFPNNYHYPDGEGLPEGILRITVIANHEKWTSLEEEEYRHEKARWFPRIIQSGLRFMPRMNYETIRDKTLYTDMFTPRTIEKYTSRLGGAVYGSTRKCRNGVTGYENLFLAGTDQGFLGIIGAMLSGISMANRHVLKPD